MLMKFTSLSALFFKKLKTYFNMKSNLLILIFLLSLILNAQKSDFHHVNFDKADSIAHSFNNSRLNNLPLLAYSLTSKLDTQVEKFRVIYTWVCPNIESDRNFAEITINKRKKFKNDSISFSNWNSQVQSGMFKKLLNDKKTICSGYAYLVKELSALANIPCEIVDGYSRTVNTNVNKIDIPNHSWNAVKLNNKWYLVDATLSSGFYLVNENKFIKNYNDGYFLAEPELFSKNHYPLDKKWLLIEDNLSLQQFVETPLIYSNTYKKEVIPISPKKLINEVLIDDYVDFKIKIPENKKIDDFNLIIVSGLKKEKIEAKTQDYANGFLNFRHQFTKKGHYDVHVDVQNDIVISYTVEVNKPN